jgi:SAM-dependent methyltransferase
MSTDTIRPHGVLVRLQRQRRPDLAAVPMEDLLGEALAQITDGEDPVGSEQRIALADALQEVLAERLEIHANRFSARRLRDLFYGFYRELAEPKPPIRDATFLDLGCGSHNPLGLSFLFAMLGARRSIGVDLEVAQDPARGVRAMARSADVLRTDPARIVMDFPVTREDLDRSLTGFDLARMRSGHEDGIDATRVSFLRESVGSLSLPTASVDVVVSNSFLEHVESIGAALDEIARVTVTGGFGVHRIDCIDHWSYGNASRHPLEFLRDPRPGMVNASNRIRFHDYPALLESHGFVVQQVLTRRRVPVDESLQASFVSPWREMNREWLEVLDGTIVVRRS